MSSRVEQEAVATAAAATQSPIDSVDAAILSFGPSGTVGSGVPVGLGPMMIPVAPFGMFPANGLPPPFSAPYLPFPLMQQVAVACPLY
jgi:hypothetical protein